MWKRILAWNVRGLGASDKRLLVKRLVLFAKADVIILLETKLEIVIDQDIRSITGSSRWRWEFVGSIGASGGIIVLWNPNKLLVSDSIKGVYSLSLICTNPIDQFKWCLTGVYGPNHSSLRSQFWSELKNIKLAVKLPWCLGRDFNVIRTSEERMGGCRSTLSMIKFNDFIVKEKLIDYPLQGALNTWKRGQAATTIMSRLDRFLVSQDWDCKYHHTNQLALPQITSDHKPILLDLGGVKWGPTPFRFETMWLREEGFQDLVEHWWQQYSFPGLTPSATL